MIMAPRVDPATARARFDRGEAIPVDVTSSLVFPAVSHRIPEAIRIAPEPIIRGLESAKPIGEVMQSLAGLPSGKEIVTYCTCPDEETSGRVAQLLRQQGYQASALRGGLAAWRAAGYPMVAKHAAHIPAQEEECPDCHEEVGAHVI